MNEKSSSSGFPQNNRSNSQQIIFSSDNLKLTYNMQHDVIDNKCAQKFNRYQLKQEYHYIIKSPIFHI